jgi:hypothetical protein
MLISLSAVIAMTTDFKASEGDKKTNDCEHAQQKTVNTFRISFVNTEDVLTRTCFRPPYRELIASISCLR